MKPLRPHGWHLLILQAAFAATLAVYWPGVYGGFLFDDYPNIVDNPGVQPHSASVASLVRAALSSPASEFKRPLASLSFAVNYLATGMNPFWMKLTNLAIHLLNGWLVFVLVRVLLRTVAPRANQPSPASDEPDRTGIVAALVAAAWLLLPINLTAVLYVVQRMESMANLFVLTGLIGYVAGRRRMLGLGRNGQTTGTRGFWLCAASVVVCTGCGILAKETAVMLPLYALLVEWIVFGFRRPDAPVGAHFVRDGVLGGGALGDKPHRPQAGSYVKLDIDDPTRTEAGEPVTSNRGAHVKTAPGHGRVLSDETHRPQAESGKKRDIRVAGLFAAVLALPLVIGLVWLLPSVLKASTWATRDFTLGTRLLSEARIVVDYIVWTLIPTPHALSFYHDDYHISTGLLSPWTTLASMLALAALVAAIIWLRKRRPLVALGLALFLGCQLLTATILPLELIYEHRNYFASFGLMLAVVPWLAGWRERHAGSDAPAETTAGHEGTGAEGVPAASAAEASAAAAAPHTWLLPRRVLLGGLLASWAALTALTAYAWGNPLRLAEDLAARAPLSPRAQYELGRTLIVYSHYDPASPFTKLAYAPLERAAALPDASILPEQALIFMNARMHLPIKDAWWTSLISKLRARKATVQDESSLGALTQCAHDGRCDLPKDRMVDAFLAALSHPNPSARLLATWGDYAWNVLGDHTLGLRMSQAASAAAPSEPAYHITVARMLAAEGRYAEVEQQIRALGALNIGGRLNKDIAGVKSLVPAKL